MWFVIKDTASCIALHKDGFDEAIEEESIVEVDGS